MATSKLARAALYYAGQGLGVFPCAPRGKTPAGRLVHNGLLDASSDLDQVAAWWDELPDANIGLVTGRDVDVLDVDGDDGWRSLSIMVHEFGCLPPSPVSLTGSGGAHYFFAPSGRNKVGFRPKLDWRGAGGYIIAPPSVHPNGKRYEWAVGLDEQPIEPAPAWLLDLLNPKRQLAAAPRLTHQSDSAPGAYAQAALERELGKLITAPEGTRNHVLNVAAFNLGQLIAAGLLELDATANRLYNAAIRTGLSDVETEATIRSGIKAGLKEPRRVAS